MSLQAALLRGVNLGKRKVIMSELRALIEGAGYTEVSTLLASGNVVLDAKAKGAKLEQALEKLFIDGLGFKTDVFVRSHAELEAVIAANPFKAFAKKDPSHMTVVFLREAPSVAEKKTLEAPQDGPEELKVHGRELYITYPAGIGHSKFVWKAFGTMRNWNTVTKLAAMTAP